MLMIIIVTFLTTILALIISTVLYLVSLVFNESDDGEDSDSLTIDTRDFATSPPVSPFDLTNQVCRNQNHHHTCTSSSIDQYVGNPLGSSQNEENDKREITSGKFDTRLSAQKRSPPFQQDQQKPADDDQSSPWATTAAAQKTMLANQLGATISKQLFDDFDQKELQLGGTGLHWCKSRKSIDRLIRIGVPLNLTNKRHETALHVAVRRKKLPVLIGLLNHACGIECRNEQGETALLAACKQNDIFACQMLLIYDADVNATDNSGASPRHHSADICDKHKIHPPSGQPNASHLILAMLHEMGAKRCPKDFKSQSVQPNQVDGKTKPITRSPCKDGCSYSGSYNGNSYNRWPDHKKESLYKRHMFTDIIEDRTNENSQPKDKKLSRLLCIDGGGMRGVIVCQILIELEKYLKKPIISYFDWVGGTSVGAFLACALCKGTPLHYLRGTSFNVKDEVFSGKKPYKSKFLERVLKRAFGSNTRMSDVKGKKLAVTTVIADRDPCQLRFFKNYKQAGELLEHYGYPSDEYDMMSVNSVVAQKLDESVKFASAPAVKVTSKSTAVSASFTPQSHAANNKDSSKNQVSTTFKPNTTQIVTTLATTSKQLPSSQLPSVDDEVDSLDDDDSREKSRNDSLQEAIIDEFEKDPLMWQAVRASGAAPFFFRPYGPYLDGGIISNNPTLDMLTEFYTYERVKSFLKNRIEEKPADTKLSPAKEADSLKILEELPSDLHLVLSLGTGRGRIVAHQGILDYGNIASGLATVFSPVELLRTIRSARELFKKLMQRSCMTDDHILDRAQAWCSSLNIPYFRVNPPLANIFTIDDKRDEQLINALWQTKVYMQAMEPQLRQLANLLDKQYDEE